MILKWLFFIVSFLVVSHVASGQRKNVVKIFKINVGDVKTNKIKRNEKHVFQFELKKDMAAIFHLAEGGNSGANIKTLVGGKIEIKEHIDNWGEQTVRILRLDSVDNSLVVVIDSLTDANDEGTYTVKFLKSEPLTESNLTEWLGYFAYSDAIDRSKYPNKDTLLQVIKDLNNSQTLVKDSLNKANILLLLGVTIVNYGGHPKEALEFLERSLSTYEGLKNQYGMALSLYEISNLHYRQGDKVRNIEYGLKALKIFEHLNSNQDVALIYNDMGLSYSILGEGDVAKRCYHLAKSKIRNKKAPLYGTICNNIGLQFLSDGAYDSAIHYFTIAVQLRSNKYSSVGKIQSLSNMSIAYLELKKYQDAVRVLTEAIKIADTEGDSHHSIVSRSILADIYYHELKEPEKTTKLIQEAFRIEGNTTNAINVVHHQMAHIEIENKRWKDALYHVKFLENERFHLEHVNRLSYGAKGYVEGRLEYFHMKIRCYMELNLLEPKDHYIDSAAMTSSKVKGRIFVAETSINEQEKEKIRTNKYIRQLADSISTAYNKRDSGEKHERLSKLYTEYQEGKINLIDRRKEGELDTLDIFQPNNSIDFVLGGEKSYVFVKSGNELKAFYLPGRSFFEDIINKINIATSEYFQADNENRRRQINALIDKEQENLSIQLRPVFAALDTGKVFVVRDGPLELIPFQSLNIGSSASVYQPAVVKFNFCYLPSFRFYASAQLRNPFDFNGNGILVFADPIYSDKDERLIQKPLREPLFQFERLSYSQNESKKVVRYFAEKNILTGFDANKDKMLSHALDGYDYIHFSTHSMFDLSAPEYSNIVLSAYDSNGNELNQRLFAFEIQDLSIKAKLVVLGSCYSAFGATNTTEGVLSLDRAFLVSGARSVVSASWSIPDSFSSDFFSTFYYYHRILRLTPSNALRKTQIDFLKTRYASSLYWGAFSYSGIE